MRSSTEVVRLAVNETVVGSIPTSAAILARNIGTGSAGVRQQRFTQAADCWRHSTSY